ncbi:helix-turn-helix transcriptional regulator [Campylobacter sp. 2018MI13]|uniref:helix-turn-helix domain-containing protein n=1 Tax=Campylobacter sp. 2018MI13 TaxID=2836737 RepID=UPI00202468A5|nr:helix-turn-helix transcriptional regulator [Campylobacter sp. 2018MI13]
MNETITKDEFLKLMKLANLNKKQLAEISGIPYPTVNAWGSRTPYPTYIKFLLENYIKAKAYDTPNDEISIKAKKYDEIKNKVLELESDNEA